MYDIVMKIVIPGMIIMAIVGVIMWNLNLGDTGMGELGNVFSKLLGGSGL